MTTHTSSGSVNDGFLIETTVDGLEYAASLLHQGKLVAFPTETVYGLGANALDDAAVRSIFVAKGRPLTDPLIVHIVDIASALVLLEMGSISDGSKSEERLVFEILGKTFWPGPLTIIAKASSIVPPAVTASTGFVGVRIPNHPIAMKLLQVVKLPIAAPSANRFGHVSPTKATHVVRDLGDKGIHVINGDTIAETEESSCKHGIESTVIKIDYPLREIHIYRQGAISQKQIVAALEASKCQWQVKIISRTVKMHATTGSDSHKSEVGQVAPGQAVTHYSPDVPCSIISAIYFQNTSELDAADSGCTRYNSEQLKQVVVIDFGGQFSLIKDSVLAYRDLSVSGSATEGARVLFDSLRWAEDVTGPGGCVFLPNIGIDTSNDDLLLGLVDRVYRAASGVIKVVHVV